MGARLKAYNFFLELIDALFQGAERKFSNVLTGRGRFLGLGMKLFELAEPAATGAAHRGQWIRNHSRYSKAPAIGGWLGFPALGLGFGTLIAALYAGTTLYAGFTFSDSNLRSVVQVEGLLLSGFAVFQLYVAGAFFRRMATAPRLVIILLISRVLFDLIDLAMVASVSKQSPDTGG
jgi:hypothetical protein